MGSIGSNRGVVLATIVRITASLTEGQGPFPVKVKVTVPEDIPGEYVVVNVELLEKVPVAELQITELVEPPICPVKLIEPPSQSC